jgi:hypothetical protein
MTKSMLENPSELLLRLIAGCQQATHFAWGGIGPCSRTGARAIDPARTWLGVFDLRGLPYEQAAMIDRFAVEHAELLFARNLVLASSWLPGQGTDLGTTPIMKHAPSGWLDAARPVLLLVPSASRIDFPAARKLAARDPSQARPSHLWARSFDLELTSAIAALADEERREKLRRELPSSDRGIFDDIHEWAVTSLLDDLVGARDGDCALFPDIEVAVELAGARGEDRITPVAGVIAELSRSERNDTLRAMSEHCGAMVLSPANAFSRTVPPMTQEFARILDSSEVMLLDEERERVWAAYWRNRVAEQG